MLRVLSLLLLDAVSADYYCEFGWCEDGKEYCCGKNKCCNNTMDRRLYWGVVLLVIFILAVIVIIRKWRRGNSGGATHKDYHLLNVFDETIQ